MLAHIATESVAFVGMAAYMQHKFNRINEELEARDARDKILIEQIAELKQNVIMLNNIISQGEQRLPGPQRTQSRRDIPVRQEVEEPERVRKPPVSRASRYPEVRVEEVDPRQEEDPRTEVSDNPATRMKEFNIDEMLKEEIEELEKSRRSKTVVDDEIHED